MLQGIESKGLAEIIDLLIERRMALITNYNTRDYPLKIPQIRSKLISTKKWIESDKHTFNSVLDAICRYLYFRQYLISATLARQNKQFVKSRARSQNSNRGLVSTRKIEYDEPDEPISSDVDPNDFLDSEDDSD